MTTATQIRPRPVSVNELRKAWHAVQEGQFRAHAGRRPQPSPYRPDDPTDAGRPTGNAPSHPMLPVLGCLGQAGASTTALALATAAGHARVVECCTATASGLTVAATAELGVTETGWALGRRGEVTIARNTTPLRHVDDVPAPEAPDPSIHLTVLDVGWELAHALAGAGWLHEQVATAPHLVAVTTATVPGLRRLETALTLLGHGHVVVAVVGPPRRRWPRPLTAGMGPHARGVDAAGDLIVVPADRHLALQGLNSTPLPAALLSSAGTLLRRVGTEPHQ